MNPTQIKLIEKTIKQTKTKLIKKAQKKGVYENFGQKEWRQINDLIGSDFYTAPQHIRNIFLDFQTWCENYTGR